MALLAGDLGPASHRTADEHLAGCADCRNIVAETARGLEERSFDSVSSEGDRVDRSSLATVRERQGRGLVPPRMVPLEPGVLVSRYQVVRPIGAGGAGVVYEAYDPQLGRRIALKMVKPLQADTGAKGSGRLLREARAMARLSHPNVVNVHDAGIFDGLVFVAMEYVDGSTVASWLAQERRGWREVVQIFVEAGLGLAAAHAAGLIHRDFKPENVLIGNDGRVRVTDFGLARAIDLLDSPPTVDKQPPPPGDRGSARPTSLTVTEAGMLAGTPAYMAPEQFQEGRADERTDQYNFCASLYVALYGQRPFAAATGEPLTLPALARKVMAGDFRIPDDDRSVPAPVFAVVRRGLSLSPSHRFAAMTDLLADLGATLSHPDVDVPAQGARTSPRARHRWLMGGVGVALLALSLVVVMRVRSGRELSLRVDLSSADPSSQQRPQPQAVSEPMATRVPDRAERPAQPAAALTAGLRSLGRSPSRIRRAAPPAPPAPILPIVAPPNGVRYGHRLKDPFAAP